MQTVRILFLTALTLLATVGYSSTPNTSSTDTSSTDIVTTLAELLTGHEIIGTSAEDLANNARVFLWELQRPGVLSTCVLLRMDNAISTENLDRDTAVLFLADLVDGTESISECDAAALKDAETQLTALGFDLPEVGELTTQGTFDASELLSDAKNQRGKLQRAFERNNR